MVCCFPYCFRFSKPLKKLKHSPPPSQNQVLFNNVAAAASEPKENTKQEEEVLQKLNQPTITEPLINLGEKTNHSSIKKVTFDLSSNTDALNKQGRKYDETLESSVDPFALSISCCPLNNGNQQGHAEHLREPHKDGAHDEHGKNVQDNLIEQESSESLFSLSIDSRKQGHASAADNVDNEVESPMPFSKNSSIIVSGKETEKATGSTEHGRSVLNPIENITHWKVVKVTATISQSQSSEHEAKENIGVPTSLDTGPTFKISSPISKRKRNGAKLAEEVHGVDTSLSSWLAESETTTKSMGSSSADSAANSPLIENKSTRNENRPTLRTLDMEELRPFSVSVSPRRSTRRSPEEKPIVGTVGSYWSCTGQTMDSE